MKILLTDIPSVYFAPSLTLPDDDPLESSKSRKTIQFRNDVTREVALALLRVEYAKL